jgi:hypothetical protein
MPDFQTSSRCEKCGNKLVRNTALHFHLNRSFPSDLPLALILVVIFLHFICIFSVLNACRHRFVVEWLEFARMWSQEVLGESD